MHLCCTDLMGLLRRYRSTGADLPFGNPLHAHHGVAMEGYFWRITDPGTGRVLIALCGANKGPQGSWATVGLAAWPNGFIRTGALDGSWTNPNGLGVEGGIGEDPGAPAAFEGNDRRLRVNLGADARVDLEFHDLSPPGPTARSVDRASFRPSPDSTSTGTRGCSAGRPRAPRP